MPRRQLSLLSQRKERLLQSSSKHRQQTVEALSELASPVDLLDRILRLSTQITPLMLLRAAPVGLIARQLLKYFLRKKQPASAPQQ